MPAISFKRILFIAVVFIGFAIVINILSDMMDNDNDGYISNTSEKIGYNDVKEYLSKVDFGTVKSSDLFKNGNVNKYTLKFLNIFRKIKRYSV
jgi:hypothetical protein